MRRTVWVGIISVWMLLGGIPENISCAAALNPQKQVEKLLTAFQRKDFRTIFQLTLYYQSELSQIKSKNPQSLWDNLTKEYYETKEKAFLSTGQESLTDTASRFGGVLFDSPTDPCEYLREMARLLRFKCDWRVQETRKEERVSQWDGRPYTAYIVYVGVVYKDVEDCPMIDQKFLEKTIIDFQVDGRTGLYVRSSRVQKGDVFWGGDPSTDVRVAKNLIRHKLYNDSIKILESLQQKRSLAEDGKLLLAAAYLGKVINENLVKYGGEGGYYGLKEGWRSNLEKAIVLDQNVRKRWIAILVTASEVNAKSQFASYRDGARMVNSVLKTAIEFSTAYPEFEGMMLKCRLDLANIYIDLAKRVEGHAFIMEHLEFAREIVPEGSPPKRSAKEFLKTLIEKELRSRRTLAENLINTMEMFDSFRFAVEPYEMPLLARGAQLVSKAYLNPFMSGRGVGTVEKERSIYWSERANEWSTAPSLTSTAEKPSPDRSFDQTPGSKEGREPSASPEKVPAMESGQPVGPQEGVLLVNEKDLIQDGRASGIARRLIGNLSRNWKIETFVFLGDMGGCLGGSNPNGSVVINRQYLSLPDDEYALLISHEIAHILLRHDRSAEKKYFPESVFGKYYYTKFSRESEYAADENGMKLLIRAGYDPNLALNLYRKEAEKQGTLGKIDKFGENPTFHDRLQRLTEFLKVQPPASHKGSKTSEKKPFIKWPDVLKDVLKERN